jgi:hypothetical protein
MLHATVAAPPRMEVGFRTVLSIGFASDGVRSQRLRVGQGMSPGPAKAFNVKIDSSPSVFLLSRRYQIIAAAPVASR